MEYLLYVHQEVGMYFIENEDKREPTPGPLISFHHAFTVYRIQRTKLQQITRPDTSFLVYEIIKY